MSKIQQKLYNLFGFGFSPIEIEVNDFPSKFHDILEKEHYTDTGHVILIYVHENGRDDFEKRCGCEYIHLTLANLREYCLYNEPSECIYSEEANSGIQRVRLRKLWRFDKSLELYMPTEEMPWVLQSDNFTIFIGGYIVDEWTFQYEGEEEEWNKNSEREILEELFRIKRDFPDAELRVFNDKELGEEFPCQGCGATSGRNIQIQVENFEYNFFMRWCMECGWCEAEAKWGGFYKEGGDEGDE